jgi:hypothetical protein
MPYIENHRATLEQRHYITLARTTTNWFNFYESRLRDYIHKYGSEFCLVIDCSTKIDDAYILPFGDFKDFFTSDFLDASHRWVGNVINENIRISANNEGRERPVSDYHDAFHLLQDAPSPKPKRPEYD